MQSITTTIHPFEQRVVIFSPCSCRENEDKIKRLKAIEILNGIFKVSDFACPKCRIKVSGYIFDKQANNHEVADKIWNIVRGRFEPHNCDHGRKLCCFESKISDSDIRIVTLVSEKFNRYLYVTLKRNSHAQEYFEKSGFSVQQNLESTYVVTYDPKKMKQLFDLVLQYNTFNEDEIKDIQAIIATSEVQLRNPFHPD